MPRERRVQYPGAIYHVMSRGDRQLGEHGIGQDTPAGREEFERHPEARRLEETDEAALKVFRRGWCLGREALRQAMLQLMEGKLGDNHSGERRLETAPAKAERILSEELGRLGWKENDLANRRKSDPGKLAIASRLRHETTPTIKPIAGRVHLGTSKSANITLHEWMRTHAPPGDATHGVGNTMKHEPCYGRAPFLFLASKVACSDTLADRHRSILRSTQALHVAQAPTV